MSEIDRPAAGDQRDDGGWRARRRVAGRRLVVLLAAVLGGQTAGWALAAGHDVLAGALIFGFGLMFCLGVGLLVPRPPGGFRWRWRGHRSVDERFPDPGFDLLGVISPVGGVLVCLVTFAWLQIQDPPLLVYLGLAIGFVLLGNGLSVGVIDVRRRHDHQRREPATPQLVEVHERPRDHDPSADPVPGDDPSAARATPFTEGDLDGRRGDPAAGGTSGCSSGGHVG